MVARQPGRPTETEFTGAALRFISDEYPHQSIHINSGYYANVMHVRPGKSVDKDIIRREQLAEGLPGEHESIRDFALRQLAAYQKQRNA